MANVHPPQPMPQLPQPNFNLLNQGLQQVATELGNFANIPPIAQGNALLQQMQQQTQQLQQLQHQMQQIQQSQQQIQQSQQQTTQDVVNVRNDIQTLRDEIGTSHRAA